MVSGENGHQPVTIFIYHNGIPSDEHHQFTVVIYPDKMSRQGQNGGKSTLNKQYISKHSIIALLRSTGKQITAEINSVS